MVFADLSQVDNWSSLFCIVQTSSCIFEIIFVNQLVMGAEHIILFLINLFRILLIFYCNLSHWWYVKKIKKLHFWKLSLINFHFCYEKVIIPENLYSPVPIKLTLKLLLPFVTIWCKNNLATRISIYNLFCLK